MKEQLVLLLLLFSAIHSIGQPGCKAIHYLAENGLPDSRIMCIVKDKEGFMWFGTQTGLTRFDGHTFTSFKSPIDERTSYRTNTCS